MSTETRDGTIVRLIDNIGLGYVHLKNTNEKYCFRFHVVPGYRGQSAKRLGLRVGGNVSFEIEDEIVTVLVPCLNESTDTKVKRLWNVLKSWLVRT